MTKSHLGVFLKQFPQKSVPQKLIYIFSLLIYTYSCMCVQTCHSTVVAGSRKSEYLLCQHSSRSDHYIASSGIRVKVKLDKTVWLVWHQCYWMSWFNVLSSPDLTLSEQLISHRLLITSQISLESVWCHTDLFPWHWIVSGHVSMVFITFVLSALSQIVDNEMRFGWQAGKYTFR